MSGRFVEAFHRLISALDSGEMVDTRLGYAISGHMTTDMDIILDSLAAAAVGDVTRQPVQA